MNSRRTQELRFVECRKLVAMSEVLLFTVTDVFLITGRGVVLTPGLGEKVRFAKTGSRIKLVRPDKSVLWTTIEGITFEGNHDILVGSEISKADVPPGTEVWINIK